MSKEKRDTALSSFEIFLMKLGYWAGSLVERKIQRTARLSKKLKLIQYLASFYVKFYCGKLYSDVLENELLALSRQLPPSPKVEPNRRKLHVATRLFDVGGHTAMLTNWILNDDSSSHDVVLLGLPYIPETTRNALKQKDGQLLDLSGSKDLVTKSTKLRAIAEQYQEVILHVHPDELAHVVAFGEGFSRPVKMFNHADQMFWLGVSITDLVYELNSYGMSVSKDYRQVSKSVVLPIIVEEDSEFGKRVTRTELGIPEKGSLIVSMASAYKFLGRNKVFFSDVLPLLEAGYLIALIGPDEVGEFKRLKAMYPNQFFVLGKKLPKDVKPILELADIYLDSYPIGSFTCMIEALRLNRPVVTAFPASTPDILQKSKVSKISDIACLTPEMLKTQFLTPALSGLKQHTKDGWCLYLSDASGVHAHKVRYIPSSKFLPCVYPAWVYFCDFNLKRYLSKLIKVLYRAF